MTSSNQTPGGYKFAPHVASQQWRVTQHESACFGIPSPWSFPSCSGIRLYPVVHPWLSLQRFISSWNVQPLVPPSCSFPLVLGCIRPLVGIDAESSEVVQETPHLLFFLPPHTARATQQFSEHHALRQFRILHARHKSRKQGPPPCVKSRVVYRCAAPIQYISAAERSEAAEPKTPPRLVRGLAGGAAKKITAFGFISLQNRATILTTE